MREKRSEAMIYTDLSIHGERKEEERRRWETEKAWQTDGGGRQAIPFFVWKETR